MKQMGTLEAQMKNIKSQLSGITATGNAGAGMVEVTVNGEHKVVSISINDIMLSPENKNMSHPPSMMQQTSSTLP